MEEMRILKAHHNTISFSEIEKHQFKHKKELSLPPIGNPNSTDISAKHQIKKGTSMESNAGSVIGGAASTVTNSPRKHNEIIDEIHKLRLHVHNA